MAAGWLATAAAAATILIGSGGDPGAPPPTGSACTIGVCSAGGFCTGPGTCAGTCSGFTSATSVTSLNTFMNNAADGAVMCLERGQIWSSAANLNATTNHPNANRVTVCASTGGNCSDTGLQNPRISITSPSVRCVSLGGVGGYNFKNLDCYGPANSTAQAWYIPQQSRDITIEGGVVDTFFSAMFNQGSSGALPDNIKSGVCGNPVEIRGDPSPINSLRAAQYGSLTNSSISINVHNFHGANTGGQDHVIDLAATGGTPYTGGSNNLTVECSTFTYSGGNLGANIKANRGQNLIVRDNVFNNTTGSCGSTPPAIGFDSHDDTPTEGWVGAQIYRNTFTQMHIQIGLGQNVDIFDNLSRQCTNGTSTNAAFTRGFVQIWYTANPEDLQVQNVNIYNNTIVRTGSGSGVSNYAMVSENPQVVTGRLPLTGGQLRNNIFYTTESSPQVFTSGVSGCNGWGTNGANIKNNFAYSSTGAPTALWNSCSGDSGNSAPPMSTDPGLVNAIGGDFHPASSGSAVCAFGTTPRPATDYDQAAWTSSEVGAFKCP